MALFYKTA